MNYETISVAYAPDDKYSPLALISMISLLENTKHKVEIIILYSNLDNNNYNLFNELSKKYDNCNIRFIKMNELDFSGFPISFWVTVQTWFRTKIADLCPDLEKVIYLDCDTLILQDISQLWNIDISNVLLGGIPDVWGAKSHIKRPNMKSNSYFNAGVLYINCEKWRKENLFSKIKQYAIENFEILECSDQDVLNKIIDTDKINLHQKFDYMETWWHNYYNEYEGDDIIKYQEAKNSPIIIHFTGTKPMHYNNFHSYKIQWWKYCALSPIYDDMKNLFLSELTPPPNEIKLKFKLYKTLLIYKLSIGKIRKKYKQKYKDRKLAYFNSINIHKENKKVEEFIESLDLPQNSYKRKKYKIAVLYIATGRYIVFWKDFYKSSQKYFLKNYEKEYFVFTDNENFPFKNKSNVHYINQPNLGWPDNTLMRFDMFLTQKNKLKNFDYIYFFNANMQFKSQVDKDILPDESGLVMGLHPGFYNKTPNEYTYDRNPESTAYIPYDQGKYYVQGCLNGGTSEAYLKLCEECSKNIHKDKEKNIVALWHDESHLNKYVLNKKFKLLPCNYLYPECWNLKDYKNDIKIIQIMKDKIQYGGIDWLRGNTDTKKGL